MHGYFLPFAFGSPVAQKMAESAKPLRSSLLRFNSLRCVSGDCLVDSFSLDICFSLCWICATQLDSHGHQWMSTNARHKLPSTKFWRTTPLVEVRSYPPDCAVVGIRSHSVTDF